MMGDVTNELPVSNVSWREVMPLFLDIICGKYTNSLPRTASVLHALGNATVSLFYKLTMTYIHRLFVRN